MLLVLFKLNQNFGLITSKMLLMGYLDQHLISLVRTIRLDLEIQTFVLTPWRFDNHDPTTCILDLRISLSVSDQIANYVTMN